MRRAGFVLTGGQSSRMGIDKALLAFQGGTLLRHQAEVVREAAGSAILIGDPARYRDLGYRVYPDRIPGCGPAGGIATALGLGVAEWNLIVACDMPRVTVEVLRSLIEKTENTTARSVVPIGPDGEPEPLCAVYHTGCLAVLDRALREKRLKMRDLVREFEPLFVSGISSSCFANVNTPAEWAEIGENSRR